MGIVRNRESRHTTGGTMSPTANDAAVHNISDRKKKTADKPGTAITSLKGLPALPKSKNKNRPQVECECGCGELTRNRFVPGHDSILRGIVLRVERGLVKLSELEEKYGATPAQVEAVKNRLRDRKKEAKDAASA